MFQGFDPQVVDFLWGIRFNNEKSWFEAHKQEYLDWLYTPMKELTAQVYGALRAEAEELGLNSKVSRIYRDARRLHGRGPYKDNLWFTVERPHDIWTSEPALWFEVDPEGYSYGLGYWYMPPLTAAKLRARMERDPKELETLVRKLNKRPELVLSGEEYKRPKGTAPTKALESWYNRKGISIGYSAPHDERLSSPALAEELIDTFRFLMPFMRYFLLLEGDPDPRA